MACGLKGLAVPRLAPGFLPSLADITGVSFALILFGCGPGLFPRRLGDSATAPE